MSAEEQSRRYRVILLTHPARRNNQSNNQHTGTTFDNTSVLTCDICVTVSCDREMKETTCFFLFFLSSYRKLDKIRSSRLFRDFRVRDENAIFEPNENINWNISTRTHDVYQQVCVLIRDGCDEKKCMTILQDTKLSSHFHDDVSESSGTLFRSCFKRVQPMTMAFLWLHAHATIET